MSRDVFRRPAVRYGLVGLAVAALGIGGYAGGRAAAPHESEAHEAWESARGDGTSAARAEGRRLGFQAGLVAGKRAGERAGQRAGRRAGLLVAARTPPPAAKPTPEPTKTTADATPARPPAPASPGRPPAGPPPPAAGATPEPPAGQPGAVAASAGRIKLTAADHDPLGDNTEHAEEVSAVVDGDPATTWTTENYDAGQLGKDGVGVVVTARKPVTPATVELRTTTPGFAATVYAATGDGTGAPPEGWRKIGAVRSAKERTTIEAKPGGPSRRFLVWITALPSGGTSVALGEIRLTGS